MGNYFFRFLLFFCLLILIPKFLTAFETGGKDSNPFTLYYEEGPIKIEPGKDYVFEILLKIPNLHYLYEEQLQINFQSVEGLKVKEIIKPEAELKDDPFFEKIVPVYYDEAIVRVVLEIPSQPPNNLNLDGTIQYQGCSDRLCFRLMKFPLHVSFQSATIVNSTHFSPYVTYLNQALEKNFVWALLVVFFLGLLTDLTGCIWPIIPVTLAIIGVRQDNSLLKNLKAIFVMVLGMAVMYSVLGIMATLVGKGLGFQFQNIGFLIFIFLLLLLMGLSLLGLFEIRLPTKLQTRLSQIATSGYHGIFFIGLTTGIMAAPCATPFVVPLLGFVSSANIFSGFFLLLSYALGMGSIFVVIGGLYSVVKLKIRSGPWNNWIKKGIGVFMLLTAFFYGQVVYSQLTASTFSASSLSDLLQEAKDQNRFVLIDFYAEWCPPCKTLDKKVFSHPKVQEALTQKWKFIKIDCTRETKQCREAIDKYGVYGWPTLIFLDRQNNEVIAERLVGTVVAWEEMVEILKRVENNQ